MNDIIEQLTKDYELLHHAKPIRSAQDGMLYFQIEAGQTAPIFVLEADEQFVAFISSGNRKGLPFDELKKLGSYRKLKLASPVDVLHQTGFKVGEVPLVELTLPTIVDERLLQYDYVFGGTSERLMTLKIRASALRNLPTVFATLPS